MIYLLGIIGRLGTFDLYGVLVYIRFVDRKFSDVVIFY
jgi:hypothetical protein